MYIRIVLLVLLALVGYQVFLKRNKLPLHIVVVFALLGGAAFLVVFPETTNYVAHAVGVGRGVDLITYLVEIAILFVIINYYTKFVELQAQITQLVRELAILKEGLGEAPRQLTEKPSEARHETTPG